MFSKEAIGYIAPITPINEEYVVLYKIEKWLEGGKTDKEIALIWNQGNSTKSCKTGKNKFGVKYDSCKYVIVVMNNLNNQKDINR